MSFTITVFRDVYAREKTERTVTVDQFVDMIAKTTAATKERLPLVKLATFGDTRTDKNSLRHDENILKIHGIEGDHDAETMSFDDALERARAANVLTILYTSPSHRPDRPRWRAICPFSSPMGPVHRAGMVDRANAIFGGVLARESWTDSQAFYYGRIADGHGFRIEIVPGDFIDVRPEIVGIGLPKPIFKVVHSDSDPVSIGDFRAAGAAVVVAATELHYPELFPLIASTGRVNVIGDDDRSVRREVARAILAATPASKMDLKRFETAFNAPIRENATTPARFFTWAAIGGWVPPGEPVRQRVFCTELSNYGRSALLNAADKIAHDPTSKFVLASEAYGIGRCAASGGVPPELALEQMVKLARALPDPIAGEEIVCRAFLNGIKRPRPTAEERERDADRWMREASAAWAEVDEDELFGTEQAHA